MKFLLNTFVFLTIPMLYIGQNNLVLNPSFEEFVTPCNFPVGAIAWDRVTYWSSADGADPDYFHECRGGDIGMPQNELGYVIAKVGKAYAGMSVYDSVNSYTDFIQGSLKKNLEKDTIYCISFWLSHADSVHYYINSKHIGIWFINYKSGYPPTATLNDSLPFIQQKVAFIPDTFYLENDSGWSELKTTYKAKGGEEYFIIGNFTPKNQVEKKYQINGTTMNGFSWYAYYYLDEVSIYRCNDTLPPPPPIPPEQYVNLPNAFSPNADGENDVFRVLGADKISEMELRIFNRWGQQVFFTTEKTQGWDGTFKGESAPTGVYAYTLVATLTNGEVIHKRGNVTLKR